MAKVQAKKAKSAGKKTVSTRAKPVAKSVKRVPAKPAAKKPAARSGKAKSGAGKASRRFKCRLCGYIYSELRGEPHNGIPAGTAFDDLPGTYVCPICGMEGKGRVGTWGFDEWLPTRYICSMCEYIYDEARGEPHHGIKPGTKFDDLPDDYRCPVCALDPKISKFFGNVRKQGFSPLDI